MRVNAMYAFENEFAEKLDTSKVSENSEQYFNPATQDAYEAFLYGLDIGQGNISPAKENGHAQSCQCRQCIIATKPTESVMLGEAVTLADCPPGLFEFGGGLGFKTEYATPIKDGLFTYYFPEAYCVSSGEYFWGGTSKHSDRKLLMVKPIEQDGEALLAKITPPKSEG